MGIVKKQALINSIFNYLGQAIGYLNIAILFPIFLTQEEFGLTRLITSLGAVYAQFSTFGTQRIAIRYFPFFKTEDQKNRGFVTLILAIPALGFSLVSLVFFSFSELLIPDSEGSLDVGDYIWAIPIVAFLALYFKVFDSYLKALYKTNLTSFLNHVLLKLLWLVSVFLYYKKVISFESFIFLYFSCQAISLTVIVIYLMAINQFNLSIDKLYFRARVIKRILLYGSFSILDDVSSVLMVHVDKIMIGFLLNLESLAVYTVATYISRIVAIPSSSLGRILVPMISPLWKQRDKVKLQELYLRSSLLNLMLSGAVFVLLWGNIELILSFIDEGYRAGLYVILLISCASMVDLAFGLNGEIIIMSKHFKFNTYSALILVGLIVAFNFILIPTFGIYGAAAGAFLAKLGFNLLKYWFLKSRENLDGFSSRNLSAFLSILAAVGISYLLPEFTGIAILEIVIRSIILSIVVLALFYFLKISEDFNQSVRNVLSFKWKG